MDRIQTLVTFAIGVCLISCDNAQPETEFSIEEDVVVDFAYTEMGDCSTPFYEVFLVNKTSNADSYLWNFGDGTTSNRTNPKKIYPKSGTYTITLTAYFAEETIQKEKQIDIRRNSDGTGPTTQLTFTRNSNTSREFTFEIATDAHDYSLDFADNTPYLLLSGSQKTIKHTFAGPGIYPVMLRACNSDGCNCAETMVEF